MRTLPSLLHTFSICFKYQSPPSLPTPDPHSIILIRLPPPNLFILNRNCSIIAREERSVTFELLNNWSPSVATCRWRSQARSSVYQCDALWYQYGGSYGSIINGDAAFVNLTFICQKHEGHLGPWLFALVEMTELHMGYFHILKSVVFQKDYFLKKRKICPLTSNNKMQANFTTLIIDCY